MNSLCSIHSRIFNNTNAGSGTVNWLTYTWNGIVVIAGSAGVFCYSTNLTTWTLCNISGITLTSSFQFRQVVYANSIWLCIPGGGTWTTSNSFCILRSTDGINWTQIDSSAITSNYNNLKYLSSGYWVVTVGGNMAYSTDNGFTWTAGTLPSTSSNTMQIEYSPTLNLYILCCALTSTNNPIVWSSPSLTSPTWTVRLSNGAITGLTDAYDCVWGNGVFVLTTGRGGVNQWYSTDGISWTVATTGFPAGNAFQLQTRYCITYNQFISNTQANGVIQSLNNGVTWTKITPAFSFTRDALRLDTNTWVMVTNSNVVVTTNNWSSYTSYISAVSAVIPGNSATPIVYSVIATGAIP